MSLFEEGAPEPGPEAPLPARLRPKSLSEFVGQEHLLGESSDIRAAIERGALGSVMLWGPAGTGKTTLARLIAGQGDAHFISRSAVTTGVADIRRIADEARLRPRKTLLFLDEIHHFSRTQQDALLGFMEDGTVTLIGATTENPTFSLATPILSRCRVLILKPLSDDNVATLIARGLEDVKATANGDATEQIIRWANGDARTALNAVEFSAMLAQPSNKITAEHVSQAMDRPLTRYDRKGDQHYDIISAFIKSVRGSDPDAALHYLARMIRAGEDPRFIARRLVILASEDIGNAQPMALLVASAAFDVVERIGMPEARIPLAQATIFLAGSPKSNSAYVAIDAALADLDRVAAPRVPDFLRDANTKRFEPASGGPSYKYPHDVGGYANQAYLADDHHLNLPYYAPVSRGYETKIAEFLAALETQSG
ncbi:MAG: replication-associated recombination protein A [Armatimonadota bacterium]|nr:replication-associated recombination protein A [Armatimonadota bacterium]